MLLFQFNETEAITNTLNGLRTRTRNNPLSFLRQSVASNAIQTVGNEESHHICYVNRIRCDSNSTPQTGVRQSEDDSSSQSKPDFNYWWRIYLDYSANASFSSYFCDTNFASKWQNLLFTIFTMTIRKQWCNLSIYRLQVLGMSRIALDKRNGYHDSWKRGNKSPLFTFELSYAK